MQLVSDVIQEQYGSVPKASFALKQYTSMLYRWEKNEALLGDCGYVYRKSEGYFINGDGEYEFGVVYVKSGKFMGKVKS